MQNKKLLIIANPKAGKAKIKNYLMDIVKIFSDADYDVTVYPTKKPGDATVKARTLKNGDYDLIVVCGGDGTLNEVITGTMSQGLKYKLGYIPCGTLNEWSSSLKIARKPLIAASDIVNGTETFLDIGKFEDKYFSYTASFGAFTEASYSAPQGIKNTFGQLAYLFEGVKSITNIKPVHLSIKCDDREIEGDFWFGAISNSMSVGGVIKYKDAFVNLTDGLFEVLLIRKATSLAHFQSIINGILRKDFDREEIEFFHTRELVVTGGKNLPWTLDGEFCEGKESVTLTNIPSGLHLIIPNFE